MDPRELYESRVIDNREFLLEDVLKHLLTGSDVNTLDIAVGYFYASGFIAIQEELEEFMDTKNGKIRIIMGNETSRDTASLLTNNEATEDYIDRIPKLMTEDIKDIEGKDFLAKIRKWIAEDRIDIKVYTGTANYFHAKTYLFYNQQSPYKGDSITGSSNFSKNGLRGNTELNVLGSDNFQALKRWYDMLWNSDEVSPFSEELLNIIDQENPEFVKDRQYQTIQETYYDYANLYAGPVTEIDEEIDWVKDLYGHQKTGIVHIADKVQSFGTAVLSDGVGLGKTRTAAAILKFRLDKNPDLKALLIVDRKLHVQWQEELAIVGVSPLQYDLTTRQLFASLDYDELSNYAKHYSFIIIDEVHQGFKNRDTQSYKKAKFLKENGLESLEAILLTATPWNNSREDVINIGSIFLNMTNIPNDRLYKQYFLYGNQGKVISALSDDDKAFDEFWEDIYLQRTRKTISSENDLFAQRNFPALDIPFEPRKNQLFSDNFDAISSLHFPYMDPIKYVQDSRYTVGVGQLKLMLLKLADSSWVAYLESIEKIINNTVKMKIKFEESNQLESKRFLKNYLGEKYDLSQYAVKRGIGSDDDIDLLEGNYFEFEMDSMIKKRTYLHRITSQIEEIDKRLADNVISRVLSEINQDLDILYGLEKQLLEAYRYRDEKYETVRDAIIEELEKGNKVIVISQFMRTAKYYKEQLSKESYFENNPFGLVVGDNSQCVIGEEYFSKNEILDRFAPRAKNKKEYIDSAEEINFIIGTDTISTGQNLQDATVMMNLDLPYNPMVLEQRIGRIDRPRKDKEITDIYVYTFPIYEAIESELRMAERLGQKIEGVLTDTDFDNVVLPEYASYLKDVTDKKDDALASMLEETVDKYYYDTNGAETHSDQYVIANSRMAEFKNNKIRDNREVEVENISFTNGKSHSLAVIKVDYRDANNSELTSENKIIDLTNNTEMFIVNGENHLFNELQHGLDSTRQLSLGQAELATYNTNNLIDELIPKFVEEYNRQIERVSEGMKRIENKTSKKVALLIRESAANSVNQMMILNKMKDANFDPRDLGELVKSIELIDQSSLLFEIISEIAKDVNQFWNEFEYYIELFREHKEELVSGDQKTVINKRKANREKTTYQLLLANIVLKNI